MKYAYDGFNYILRLDKNESLSAMLQQFAAETQTKGAWMSGIGTATELTIGAYRPESQDYKWQTFKKQFEIISLQGNLSTNQDGKPFFHLHGSFGDSDFGVIGGHLQDLKVLVTLEMFIHRTDGLPLRRKLDDKTGIQLLDL